MEIVISKSNFGFAVRTSRGGLTQCDTIEQARTYARGLADGWDAAARAITPAAVREEV